MGSEWRNAFIGELIRLQRGHDLTDKQRVLGNVPVMGSAGLNGYHNTSKAKGPGLVIGRSGASFGKIHFCATDYWPHNTALYVTDFLGNDELFTFYYLKRIDFSSYNTGSAQPSLNRNHVYQIPIKLPPLSEQKAIAHVLGSLDDKIELNRKMNATLEEMAQALFKSWFVDFDPVIDNAIIAGNEIPEEFAERAEVRRKMLDDGAANREVAGMFPDSFKYTEEMGWIPEGWGISTIGNEFNVIMGQSPKGDTFNEVGDGMLFFQGRAEFGWRFPKPRLYTTAPNRLASKGDTLMSVRAPVGDFNMALNDCCVGRGLCALRHRSGSSSFTYYQMKDFRKKLDKFNGEGTVFGSINQKDLKDQRCLSPSEGSVNAFVEIVERMDSKILNISKQVLLLSKLRDTLLPKLISGELRISNFERIVGELI